MKKRNNAPFYDWVPRPLGMLVYILMLFPVMCTNGAYMNNAGEMKAALGIISEHIQFSAFASGIGMVVFVPYCIFFLKARRSNTTYIGGFSLMFIFSYICAITNSLFLLCLVSFLMGFLRTILLFNTLYGLMDYLTGQDSATVMFADPEPDNNPSGNNPPDNKGSNQMLMFPVMYFILLSITQLGSALTSWLAYTYQWQDVYYWMMGMLLVALFLVLVTMKYQKRKPLPKIQVPKFADMVALSAFLLSVTFILIYGKTLDWFDSRPVRIASIVGIVSLGFTITLARTSKTPYIDFRVLSSRNLCIAIFLFIAILILNSSSALVSVFAGLSMKPNNLQAANLSNYSIVGNLIGALIAVLMAAKKAPFRYMFATSFLLMTVSAGYMYFQFQSEGLYSHLIFPTIIRSAGMIIIYAMGTVYSRQNLPMKFFLACTCLTMIFRSVLAPVAGNSLYTNVIYERQN